MYAIQYSIGDQKRLLKNHALKVLGVNIPDSIKSDVIVFADRKQAELFCRQYKEGKVVEYEYRR